MTEVYRYKIPIRIISIIKLGLGLLILYSSVALYLDEIYFGIYTVAGFLLSFALGINALTKTQIQEINVFVDDGVIEFTKAGLFRSSILRVSLSELQVALKTGDGKKKKKIFLKLRLLVFDGKEEIEEIVSGFLSLNNFRIKKIYKALKTVVLAQQEKQ